MKFEAQVSNKKQKFFEHLTKLLPIENEKRTKLNQCITFLIYCFDYVLILYIIALYQWSIFNINSSPISVLVLQMIRTFCNLCFIFTKAKIFLLLQRLCLLTHILFKPEQYSLNYLVISLLDIAANAVWVLSIQQRNTHFDSRLFLKFCLIKQSFINISCIIWITFRYFAKSSPIFYVAITIILLFFDLSDYIYNQKFKKMLISIDFYCILISIIPLIILNTSLQYSLKTCLSINAVYLVATCVYIYISPLNFGPLFTTRPWTHNIQQRDIIQFVITLDQLIMSENEKQTFKFIVYHIHHCKQPDCFLKYHQKWKEYSNITYNQTLKHFKKQALLSLVKRYKILNEYLVFNYQNNSQKAIAKFNPNNFFHYRENQKYFDRIQQKRQKTKKITTQFINQLNLMPKIKQFAESALQFWSELMQYKVNGSKIVKLGIKQLKIIKQIEKVVQKGYILTQRSRMFTNICLTYLLNRPQGITNESNQIHVIQNNFLGYSEAPPTLLISAQKQNFLSLINANIALVKISGYTKDQITSLKLDALWDKQIREEHIVLAEKRARYNRESTGQVIHSYAFIKNKFGYAVIVDAIVYYYDSQNGKSWCVKMEPYLDNQAVIIINYRRQLVGISQNCLQFGLETNMEGFKLNEYLFTSTINSKSGMKLKNKTLFQGKQFTLKKILSYDHILKYQTEILFKDRSTYFLFTINKIKSKKYSVEQRTIQQIRSSMEGGSSSRPLNVSKKISYISSQQIQTSNFQFSFNMKRIKFTGSQIKDKNISTLKSVFGDINIDRQQQQQQYIPFKYNDDIVQMRYWDGKLDFIQNLQPPILIYESLPQYKLKQSQLNEQLIKQDYNIRNSKTLQNIKIIRIFTISITIIAIILLAYINIYTKINENKLIYDLKIQQLSLQQISQLATLSSILISQNYNKQFNINDNLNIMVNKIDTVYKTIQIQTQDLNIQIISQIIQQYNLIKSDQIYRLLIKNYLNSNNNNNNNNNTVLQINNILQHYLKYLQPGWLNIIKTNYYNSQIQNKKHITNIFIFTGIIGFITILLYIIYYNINNKINKNTKQICDIFISIQHNTILANVIKYKSFINSIDYDYDLYKHNYKQQKQQIQQKQQQILSYTYKKYTVNNYKNNKITILFIILLILCISSILIYTYKQYNICKSILQNIKLYHLSHILIIDIKSIWIRLHLNNMHVGINRQQIYGKYQQIYQYHRELELLALEIVNDQYIYNIDGFIKQYIYGNLCQQYIQNCNNIHKQLQQLTKDGFKSITSSIILKTKRIINKYSTLQNLIQLNQSKYLYIIDTYYINIINQLINNKIQQQIYNILQYNNTIYGIYFTIFIIAIILLIIWYIILVNMVKQIMELEIILWGIPWRILRYNWKYFRYINKNKIKQR